MKWEELTAEQQEYFKGLLRKGNTFPDGGQTHVEKNDATYVAKRVPPTPPELGPQWEEGALNRANRVYTNYEDAKDAPISGITDWMNLKAREAARYIKDNIWDGMHSGISNCTLTATQWVDPRNPIKNASSITKNPSQYGYTPVDSADVVPGNLLITKHPDKESYHTMIVTGFAPNDGLFNFDGTDYAYKKGEPLLTYSRGGHGDSNLRRNVPLSVYTANSDGKTNQAFFRYNYPNEVFLPEVVITPDKKYFKSRLTP